MVTIRTTYSILTTWKVAHQSRARTIKRVSMLCFLQSPILFENDNGEIVKKKKIEMKLIGCIYCQCLHIRWFTNAQIRYSSCNPHVMWSSYVGHDLAPVAGHGCPIQFTSSFDSKRSKHLLLDPFIIKSVAINVNKPYIITIILLHGMIISKGGDIRMGHQ